MTEGLTVEYKREYTKDLLYAVIAFANTAGGKLYIGIEDDGSIRGVEDPDETMLRLTNLVRETIRPDVTLFCRCETERLDGKEVVVLTVMRGTARPYYLHGKGVRPEGVYVRQGASSVPASETAILSMIRETSGDRYEEGRSLEQELTFETARRVFADRSLDFGAAQQRTLKLIGPDGTYSNLGLLLSDQCPHSIKIAVFEGVRKTVFKDRVELTGSLLRQLEEAFATIDRYNRTRSDFDGLRRIDRRDYPVEALREALLNAIVHRDYALSGPTLISLFDDRIEFVTLGGLVPGIAFDDVMLGVSALRNGSLAGLFYRLGFIEAYGTGIMKINECYGEEEQKPRFEISGHAFKVTLPNRNLADKAAEETRGSYGRPVPPPLFPDPRFQKVLALFADREELHRKEVEEALGISQSTAGLLLRRMVEAGWLRRYGATRGAVYLRAEP